MSNLTVIVDPSYGGRLEGAAHLAPVWIVDTEINRAAYEQMWKGHPQADHRENGAITSYKTPNAEDRLGSLLGIMLELETHHGDLEDNELVFPAGFVLGVVGLALSDHVTSALRELGFRSFLERPDGFEACK